MTFSEQALTSVPELKGICAFLMNVTLTSLTAVPSATDLSLSAVLYKFFSLILLHFPTYALKMVELSPLRFWPFKGYFFSLSGFHCLWFIVCNCGETDQRRGEKTTASRTEELQLSAGWDKLKGLCHCCTDSCLRIWGWSQSVGGCWAQRNSRSLWCLVMIRSAVHSGSWWHGQCTEMEPRTQNWHTGAAFPPDWQLKVTTQGLVFSLGSFQDLSE